MSWSFSGILGEKLGDRKNGGFDTSGTLFLGKEICDAMAGRIRGFRRVMTRTFCSISNKAQNRLKSNARLKKSTFGPFLPKSWFPNFTGFFECTFWRHFFTFRNRSFWTDFWAENLLSGFFAEDPLVEVLGRSVRDPIYLAGFSVFDLSQACMKSMRRCVITTMCDTHECGVCGDVWQGWRKTAKKSEVLGLKESQFEIDNLAHFSHYHLYFWVLWSKLSGPGSHFFGIWDFAHCSLWHIFGIWISDFRVLDFEEGGAAELGGGADCSGDCVNV